ncbi:uncharacterized protein [Syngnathus scovelli]|uniref:uncharacterized protein isoform X2 n=1 Tax=Syngnathus scovelli TaxID=161590 RepID=UPI0035CA0033
MSPSFAARLLMTLTLSQTCIELFGCPTGWLEYNKHCYFFGKDLKTWWDARVECAFKGAHLTTILDRREQDWLQSKKGGARAWIGLRRETTGKPWQWADGTSFSYSAWNVGEPNNVGGNEHCVEMFPWGHWNDVPCHNLFPYICKRPVSPTTTTAKPATCPAPVPCPTTTTAKPATCPAPVPCPTTTTAKPATCPAPVPCPTTTTAKPATCPAPVPCPTTTTAKPATCPAPVPCPTTTTAKPATCPAPVPCPTTTTAKPATCPAPVPCPTTTTAKPATCPTPAPCPICPATTKPATCPAPVPCPTTTTAKPATCPAPAPCPTTTPVQPVTSPTPAPAPTTAKPATCPIPAPCPTTTPAKPVTCPPPAPCPTTTAKPATSPAGPPPTDGELEMCAISTDDKACSSHNVTCACLLAMIANPMGGFQAVLDGLSVARTIVIRGQSNPKANKLVINLDGRDGKNVTAALHLNMDLESQTFTLNSGVDRKWSDKQTGDLPRGHPFGAGLPFKIVIKCGEMGTFHLDLNDELQLDFAGPQLDIGSINWLEVWQVMLSSVQLM